MSECKFCTDYDDLKRVTAAEHKKVNEDQSLNITLRSRYSLRIIENTYRKFRDSGITNHAGQFGMGNYPINFCPVCGKRKGK